MAIETLEDIYQNIKRDFGVVPEVYDRGENYIKYRNIAFSKNTGQVMLSNKSYGDLYLVERDGHSIDYMRPEELENAISIRGSLPYFFA